MVANGCADAALERAYVMWMCVCIWKPNCGERKERVTRTQNARVFEEKLQYIKYIQVNGRKKRNNSIKYEFNRKKVKERAKKNENGSK